MKLTAFILATYISFLTVEPLAKLIYSALTQQTDECCGENCCENEQACNRQKSNTDNQDPNNCCPNGICNPFEQCACCFSITEEHAAYNYIAIVSINKYILPATVSSISNYSTDCFHPPEID